MKPLYFSCTFQASVLQPLKIKTDSGDPDTAFFAYLADKGLLVFFLNRMIDCCLKNKVVLVSSVTDKADENKDSDNRVIVIPSSESFIFASV